MPSMPERPHHPETRALHDGHDPRAHGGAVRVPLDASSTYLFASAAKGRAAFERAGRGEASKDLYARMGSPTLAALETRLKAWDDAESALAFASGMGAITSMVLALADTGDVIVHSQPVYGGTVGVLDKVFSRWGLQVATLPPNPDAGALRTALEAARARGRVRLVHVETPANPTNDLVDIGATAEAIARAWPQDPPVFCVDNTFLGPCFQHPLAHGADLVLYSATKFLGGHSDLLGGVLVGPEALVRPVRTTRNLMGTTMGTYTAWMLLRSLDTVGVRMRAACATATQLAPRIAAHDAVEALTWLGALPPGSREAAIYDRQCEAPGSLLALDLGTEARATAFLDALRVVSLAVSLGGTETLAQHPASMTHLNVPLDVRRATGVGDGLVRLSVGLEHVEDLWADLAQALDASVQISDG